MAFIAGALVVGGVIIAHDNHSNYSDYSDYSDHRNHRQYGDSNMVNSINLKRSEINRLANNLESHRRNIENDFNERIERLRNEKNYDGLRCSENYMIDNIKEEMKREIDESIEREKQELADIDRMIAKINELELNAK